MKKAIRISLIIIASFTAGFFVCFGLNIIGTGEILISPNIHFINANSHADYFSVHRIREAWKYSKGAGVKIGILDHGFGINEHQDLYSGWEDFRSDNPQFGFAETVSHGFWMASTLREIAPDAEIFALGITFDSEDEVIQEITKAVEWAVEKDIRILTYSSKQFTEAGRAKLDKALVKAYEKGIITIFLHYPNPENILTSEIDPRITGLNSRNNADIGIYKYDYSNILGRSYTNENRSILIRQHDFLSISSRAPVAAGIISLMLSEEPDLNRDELKRILHETSYTYDDGEESLENAVNAKAAIEYITNQKGE